MKNILPEQHDFLIPLLNSKLSFDLFNKGKTFLEANELSFFENYILISAKTFSTIPPVTIDFLWNRNNNDIIKLDGSRDCIFNNINKLGVKIDDDNLADYLKFVLGNIQSEQGTLRLVQSIADVEYSAEPTEADLRFLSENITPFQVNVNEDECIVKCCILYGDALFLAEINFFSDGTFEFLSEEKLKDNLPVRQMFLE